LKINKKQNFGFFFKGFVGSWFLIFFIAVLYEGLKTLRDILAQRDLCDACSPTQNRSQGL